MLVRDSSDQALAPQKGNSVPIPSSRARSYTRRHRWRDGTTHLVFEPLVFLERLAALVPRPREHLLTYHGVLAPASSWRDFVVPQVPHPTDGEDTEAACVQPPAPVSPEAAAALLAAACPDVPLPAPSVSAPLLRRVFQVDVLTCPACGSRRRLIALISDPPIVRRILRASRPARRSARPRPAPLAAADGVRVLTAGPRGSR